MKIIALVGPSGSGKTTLAAALVRELKSRGLSVAAVKHAPHGFDMDTRGKDSWLYTAAGADGVALVSEVDLAVLRRTGAGADPAAIARTAFAAMDVVLIEGGKSMRGVKKVEVLPPGARAPLTPPEELIAVAADGAPAGTGRPVFARSDAAGLAAFIIAHVEDDMTEVRLEIDGREILLNAFVQAFMAETVRGMVKPLSGVPEAPRTISLTIGPPAGGGGAAPSEGSDAAEPDPS